MTIAESIQRYRRNGGPEDLPAVSESRTRYRVNIPQPILMSSPDCSLFRHGCDGCW